MSELNDKKKKPDFSVPISVVALRGERFRLVPLGKDFDATKYDIVGGGFIKCFLQHLTEKKGKRKDV